jgi:NADPH:quinone reductase-like Zn-dependent oxidoreductase
VRADETVLVFGIGGGVSLAALQLAKAAGAKVIVTSRDAAKLERVVQMGADAGVHSSATQDIARTVLGLTGGRGVDVVIENVGAAVWGAALKSLVRGGRLVTCGATSGDQPGAGLRRMFIRQLKVFGSTLGTLAEFRDLLAFCERSSMRPVIDSRNVLDEVPQALARLESGGQFEKIALAVE